VLKPTIAYCEAATQSLIRRPYYFLSNFVYLGLALWLLTRKGILAKQFGVIALLVGVASSLYDMTFLYLFQLIDLGVMIVFISFLIYLNYPKAERKYILSKLSLIGGLAVISIFCLKGVSGDVVFGLYVVFFIWQSIGRFGLTALRKSKWASALLVFVLGFAFWIMDFTKVYCSSFGLLNGRSVFHYTTAISIFLLYGFYSQLKE